MGMWMDVTIKVRTFSKETLNKIIKLEQSDDDSLPGGYLVTGNSLSFQENLRCSFDAHKSIQKLASVLKDDGIAWIVTDYTEDEVSAFTYYYLGDGVKSIYFKCMSQYEGSGDEDYDDEYETDPMYDGTVRSIVLERCDSDELKKIYTEMASKYDEEDEIQTDDLTDEEIIEEVLSLMDESVQYEGESYFNSPHLIKLLKQIRQYAKTVRYEDQDFEPNLGWEKKGYVRFTDIEKACLNSDGKKPVIPEKSRSKAAGEKEKNSDADDKPVLTGGTCRMCGRKLYEDELWILADGSEVCENCLHDLCEKCYSCHQYFKKDAMTDVDGKLYCSDCLRGDCTRCSSCGKYIAWFDAIRRDGVAFCGKCSEAPDPEKPADKTVPKAKDPLPATQKEETREEKLQFGENVWHPIGDGDYEFRLFGFDGSSKVCVEIRDKETGSVESKNEYYVDLYDYSREDGCELDTEYKAENMRMLPDRNQFRFDWHVHVFKEDEETEDVLVELVIDLPFCDENAGCAGDPEETAAEEPEMREEETEDAEVTEEAGEDDSEEGTSKEILMCKEEREDMEKNSKIPETMEKAETVYPDDDPAREKVREELRQKIREKEAEITGIRREIGLYEEMLRRI